MSDAQDKLVALRTERAGLEASRTQDDADRAAKAYAEAVRQTHAEVGGFVLGGAILGDPLASVLHAYIVSRPEFEAWLALQARAVTDNVSDRQKKKRLTELDGAIEKAVGEVREEARVAALAAVEEQFADAGA